MHTKCSCVCVGMYMRRGFTIWYRYTLTKSKPFCKIAKICSNSLSRQEKCKVEIKYLIYKQLLYMEWSFATIFLVWGKFYFET